VKNEDNKLRHLRDPDSAAAGVVDDTGE